MNIKEKILNQALTLFNTEGVENITTRHIAKPLNISQGNLHYHYPNKNEVIEALFCQFQKKIEGSAKYQPEQLFKKEQVLASIKVNFEVMWDYRFLFKNNEVVWRRIPAIKSKMIHLLNIKKHEIHQIIIQYQAAGIFRPDISDKQITYLTDQFLFSISTWLIAKEYVSSKKNTVDYFAKLTFRLWLPYLTKNDMQKWEALLK